MKKDKRVAFIGSVGVPNLYGGFELFLDACAPAIAEKVREVFVTCDSSKYADHNSSWRGVNRIFIPIRANGASSVFHDLLAFLTVFFRSDVIVVLGVSAGIFFPIFKLLTLLFGKKLIVNVDGIEWRRDKFSFWKRYFLFISDRLAQIFSDVVIIDNEGLRKYLTNVVRAKAVYIPYSGDHIVRRRDLENNLDDINFLTICRIEPENNCHILLDAFVKFGKGRYVFIGNWDSSEYGRELRACYSTVPGLTLLDPEYRPEKLQEYREWCTTYLHGHFVGGTNPSLVEMLFYDCRIIAFDCEFNRLTTKNTVSYFNSSVDLVLQMGVKRDIDKLTRVSVREQFTRSFIAREYVALF